MSYRKPNKFTIDVNDDGCFVCTSHKSINEYGHRSFRKYGRNYLVHRYIYEECFGFIADDLVVRHKCDNPSCINPEHLEVGTHADNVMDKVKRERVPKGSSHSNSKFTEDDVKFIKRNPQISARELVEKFGVSKEAIYKIRQGIRWSHVTPN